MEHLQAYGFDKDRDAIIKRVADHNNHANDFEKKVKSLSVTEPIPEAFRVERDALAENMTDIWKSAQEFAQKLLAVINDIEDDTLLGDCGFEKHIKWVKRYPSESKDTLG